AGSRRGARALPAWHGATAPTASCCLRCQSAETLRERKGPRGPKRTGSRARNLLSQPAGPPGIPLAARKGLTQNAFEVIRANRLGHMQIEARREGLRLIIRLPVNREE